MELQLEILSPSGDDLKGLCLPLKKMINDKIHHVQKESLG